MMHGQNHIKFIDTTSETGTEGRTNRWTGEQEDRQCLRLNFCLKIHFML